MKAPSILALAAALSSCTLPPPDQPASPNRTGRFLGLVASCGCSDITPQRMLAEYPLAVAGLYFQAEIRNMHGYVDVGAHENYDNQIEICAGVCSQTCMVNAVAKPLGGRLRGDGATCLVNERDLHLGTGVRRDSGRPF
ncbi:MAG: hypothetical protein H7Y60_10610 [Rhodospirillaceae bacterium]|nr:hypothetical protein [Rhodospirillales bacterium]